MIDLTPIKPYILDDADYYIIEANKAINKTNFDEWFENQLSKFLNCSKLSSSGHRLIQTNHIHYSYEITAVINMIETFADNKDYYYEKLLALHNNNLKFEAEHGFEYISLNDKPKKKASRKRSKQTSIDFNDKPKKETAAERKLKAHVAKIQSLNIKLKPVKNGNTL